MKRLVQAPNAAIATLWADLLRQAGIDVSVQRYYTGSIAGEIPPDQALPEVWVLDDDDHARATATAARAAPPAAPALGVRGLRRDASTAPSSSAGTAGRCDA